MEKIVPEYKVLTKGFTNMLGSKAYRLTLQSTRAEIGGKGLVYFFYANDMEYRILTATFHTETETPPETDAEISSILKSLSFIK